MIGYMKMEEVAELLREVCKKHEKEQIDSLNLIKDIVKEIQELTYKVEKLENKKVVY